MINKKTFKIPLYRVEVTVIIYTNENDITETSKEYPLKDRVGCVYRNEDNEIICVLNQYLNLSPGEIAHEAKHIVNEIFIDVNHKLSRHNDEPEAYLLGWVVDKIHEFKNKIK